ncbi:MAG: alpha/beta fold hydrolase [Leptospiraceae bacterium]|nr:alpha/beta fold hydrolase [Leptospiraceae bacterium]
MMNWLLIRGLGREKRHWGDFIKMLQQETDGDVLCLDIPGSGDFREMQSPVKIKGYILFLRDKLPKKQQWSICAISLGGMIALEWLSLYPDDFQNAVIINTSALDVGRWHNRLRFSILHNFIRTLLQKDAIKREEILLKITTNLQKDITQVAEKNAKIYKEKPITRKNIIRQLYAASKFRSPQNTIENLCFLSSKEDKLVNPKCSELLSQKYKKKHFQHLTAGHDLPLDDPKWIIETMKQCNFLKKR